VQASDIVRGVGAFAGHYTLLDQSGYCRPCQEPGVSVVASSAVTRV
jgi:hypothetical protein